MTLPLVVAIDSGATSATTFEGVTFIADKYYSGGSPSSTTDTIAGVADGAIYKTERYGDFKYEIPVTANGSYTVTLHFAEIFLNSAGLRNFSVSIEGTTRISNLDLYAEAGHDGALSRTIENIQVNDKKLTIEMIADVENPTLAALAVYSNDGQLDTTQPEPTPGTGSKKFVGNITTGGQVRSDFIQYWNQITPENEGKWGSVEGTRNQYNWGPLDRIYDYARQHNIPVKAHTFVWGAQAPSWISGLSAADQRAEIEQWIKDYCTRYPDTAMIDVVNEAVEGHAPARFAANAFGNDWITESFKLARKHCPDAELIYNDFNFLTWDTEAILTLIDRAVKSGYVDAIGLQSHSLYDPKVWSAQEIKDKLDDIHRRTGLPMYISEYDIEATDDQTQLNYMKMHFPVFYEHPHVKGVTLWGYIYGSTWRTGTGLIRNGQPRPALTWLMDYLKDK